MRTAPGAQPAPGYLFTGPAATGGAQPGTLILDNRGHPVWFRPVASGKWVTGFTTSRYRGRPVLTWWEGDVDHGYGRGEGVIADASYREIARVRAASGRTVDLHEFVLSPSGTALFLCTPAKVQADLSSLGGSRDATVLESIIQERDVASGRLIMEWRSLDHIAPEESYRGLDSPFDYLHANSIDVAPDGNLLISARHTWAVYKLDRHTGAVIWRLGGKRSDFDLGPGARFAWQHDARHVAPGVITLFDDGSDGKANTEPQSRGLRLAVDERAKRVRVARQYRHPSPLLATSMGSTQTLDGGHVVVGWGHQPWVTEFAGAGAVVVCDLRLLGAEKSYRGFRLRWDGSPRSTPALAAVRDRRSRRATVYASWNGATAVTRWRLHGGGRRSDLRPLGTARHRGFETAISIGTGSGYAQVAALDRAGRTLAHSRVIAV